MHTTFSPKESGLPGTLVQGDATDRMYGFFTAGDILCGEKVVHTDVHCER